MLDCIAGELGSTVVGTSPKGRLPLLAGAAPRSLAAALGFAAALGGVAAAQCNPELDAQSGAPGALFSVGCAGTDLDPQGDGTNQYVSIAVSGVVDTPVSNAIWLRSNNVVNVASTGLVSGFTGVRLGDFSSTPTVGNSLTVASAGRINSTVSFGVYVTSGSDVLTNQMDVNGVISAIQFESAARVGGNRIAVNAGGQVSTPQTFIASALKLVGVGVDNNVVTVGGTVSGFIPATPNPTGVEFVSVGPGSLNDNRIVVAAGGRIDGEAGAIRLQAQDFNNEGPITPAGDLFRNDVTIAGTAASSAGDGVEISNTGTTAGAALVRDNTVSVTGGVTAAFAGVRMSGGGVRTNTVDIAASGATLSAAQGVVFNNIGSAAFTGNVARVAAGASITTSSEGVYFWSTPRSVGLTQSAADIAANQANIAGSVIATNAPAISFLSNAATRDNIVTVSGLARSQGATAVQLFASGAVSGNTVTVAQGGRIEAQTANRIGVQFASVGGGGASNNTVDNSGVIQGTTAVSFGPGSGNRLINRATGSINGDVIFTSTASELVLFAGSALNGAVGGAGAAAATLQGPGQATLDFGRFSNMGALNVAGGRWTATGSGAGFSSASIASGAELVLNGSLIRPLTIAPGGVLSGNGTTGALTVGGGLAPGNSIGTTNVVGPLTFAPSSTYAVEVGGCPGPCADRVIATGPVTINGGTVALSVFGAPGPLAGRVPIVTGASVSGTFASLSAPAGAFSTAFLDYTPTDVFLNFSLGPSLTGATHGASVPVSGYGVTLLTRSLLSPGDEEAGRLPGGGGCALYVFSDGSPSQRVEGAPREEKGASTRAWARGLGARGLIDADHGLSDTRYHFGAFAVGVERSGGGVSIGFGVGSMQTRIRSGGHALAFDSALMMAYAGYESGPFSVGLAGAAARHSVNSAREVAPSDTARGAFSGWTWGLAAEAGYGFKADAFEATPFVGVDYTRTTFGAFTESGASFANLSVPRREGDALRASVGARFTTDKRLLGVFKPGLRLAYAREFLSDGVFNASYAATPSASFSVDAAELGRDRLLVGAGVAMQIGERGSLSLSYDGEFSNSDHVQGGTARFAVAF